ncbi:MAG TPA: hypothetical protein VHH12_15455 [Mycobacterium sp.]|nr:hypothetical protein [Mycobacterium sp.]
MNTFLTATALAVGLPGGFAAGAGSDPESDDFPECAAEHIDDIDVCCVVDGGDYDESTGECWMDHEAKPEEANAGPGVPLKHPVLTREESLPLIEVS